jgi:hypothetical protein
MANSQNRTADMLIEPDRVRPSDGEEIFAIEVIGAMRLLKLSLGNPERSENQTLLIAADALTGISRQ